MSWQSAAHAWGACCLQLCCNKCIKKHDTLQAFFYAVGCCVKIFYRVLLGCYARKVVVMLAVNALFASEAVLFGIH